MTTLLLLLVACEPDTPAPTRKVGEPSVPEDGVMRLAFDHAGGSIEPGTGFAAHIPGQAGTIGVTAHHLFSPAGGLERELYAAEVPRFVLGIHPTGLDGKKLPDAGPMLYIPGAQVTVDKQDWTSDIAAFKVPSFYDEVALTLSQHNAKPDETLWLVVVPKTKGAARYHKVDVMVSNRTLLLFRLLDATFDPHGASGSPIVNKKGEVVGMNTAEGTDGVNWWGSAHPVESMITKLATVQ